MNTNPTCPSCGKPLAPTAPQGLCQECLLQAGFPTGTEAGEKRPRFIPPPIADLSAKFPQLELLEFVGQGGMGAVYKARQRQLDRIVALKILPPETASGPGFAERFTREARALARLNHPHIVTLYEFGQAGELFYFLMEFVDGINLRQLLNASRIAPKEALAIVPQICDALQFAHERGIVHRDIKPENNILLSKSGQVKIADFGVAKIAAPGAAENSDGTARPGGGELTGAGSTVGTPNYMAPEQTENSAEVDHRADIYSLGVVFYQMLTGELPAGKIAPPSQKVIIDVRLDEVVLRALEKKPESRYQNVSEIKARVETIATTAKDYAPLENLKTGPSFFVPARLRDRWGWDMVYFFWLIFIPLPILALLLAAGGRFRWLCSGPAMVLLFPIIYSWVRIRIRRLREHIRADAVDVIEVVIAQNNFQAPGLAVLYRDRIELFRIIGAPIFVNTREIVYAREIKWFNHASRLWWKKCFEIKTADARPIHVAIPEPTVPSWKRVFHSPPKDAVTATLELKQPEGGHPEGSGRRAIVVGGVILAIALIAAELFGYFGISNLKHLPEVRTDLTALNGNPRTNSQTESPSPVRNHDNTSVVSGWPGKFRALNQSGWREAFDFGHDLAKLPPNDGWTLLERNWTSVTNTDARQQLLKAFMFAEHPRLVAALELGFLDPSPAVQNWALRYLKAVALRDFSMDASAARDWLKARRAEALTNVLTESAQWLSDDLRHERGNALRDELKLLAENSSLLRQHMTLARQAGLGEALAAACANPDAQIAGAALKSADVLDFGDDWAQRSLLSRIGKNNPTATRLPAIRALGKPGRMWATDPLMAVLTEAVDSQEQDPGILMSTAAAVAEIGSPRTIPGLIHLIENDPSGKSIYNIGYFGLSPLTGVSYDPQHDGAWWRQWWEKNKERFSSR